MGSAEVLAVAAAVLAGAASPGVSVVEIVGAGRCRVIPGAVALAECPTEYLASVHACLAFACYFLPDFFRPFGTFTRNCSSRAFATVFPMRRTAPKAANWALRGRDVPCSHLYTV